MEESTIAENHILQPKWKYTPTTRRVRTCIETRQLVSALQAPTSSPFALLQFQQKRFKSRIGNPKYIRLPYGKRR
jgi:hypothetical protein